MRRIDLASTLLPQPLSRSPRPTEMDVKAAPSTAPDRPSSSRKVTRSRTGSGVPLVSTCDALASVRIGRVTQTVAHEVPSQHGQDDEGRNQQPGALATDYVLGLQRPPN